jgi:hypothetical protein
MKVERLPRYGATLSGLPREAMKAQQRILLREIKNHFGVLGLLPFFVRTFLRQRALRRNHPEAYSKALAISKSAAREITMLIAMYEVLARKEGKEGAYEVLKKIFQQVAVHSMPALYQVDDLVKCEGDTFDNFAKFNVAFFNAMNDERTWIVDRMEREDDKLTIVVTECANCVVGEAFDCPEIARLGCDHDLAGYPVILDKVDAEFRRPHTIAKGDAYCDFMFYRKGTAPNTEHLNK